MIPAFARHRQGGRGGPGELARVLALLGVLPGALAYVSWSFVLSKIPASKAGSFIYCVAPLTVLIAWILAGRRYRASCPRRGLVR